MLQIMLAAGLALATACDDDERSDPDKCEEYCAPGSAFPCPCNAIEGCNDGSHCVGINLTDPYGFCAKNCVSNEDCITIIECTASPQCVLTVEDAGPACAYICEGNWDCPKHMDCVQAGNGKLCYPNDDLAAPPDAG
jgi:hypothetical protein